MWFEKLGITTSRMSIISRIQWLGFNAATPFAKVKTTNVVIRAVIIRSTGRKRSSGTKLILIHSQHSRWTLSRILSYKVPNDLSIVNFSLNKKLELTPEVTRFSEAFCSSMWSRTDTYSTILINHETIRRTHNWMRRILDRFERLYTQYLNSITFRWLGFPFKCLKASERTSLAQSEGVEKSQKRKRRE